MKIDRNSGLTLCQFPKNMHSFGGNFNLVLRGASDVSLSGLTDSGDSNYYRFAIDFSDIQDGEYEYRIICPAYEEKGVLQLGEYLPMKRKIYDNNVQFKAYDATEYGFTRKI